MISCFTGIMKNIIDVEIINEANYSSAFEADYFLSKEFIIENEAVISGLTRLISEYKSEEYILNGGTISEDEIRMEEDNLYDSFRWNSRSYNPNLSEAQNYEIFKKEYADKLAKAREQLIKNDLRELHFIMQNIAEHEGMIYYATDGKTVYSNTSMKEKQQFKKYPAYMVFEKYKQEIYPENVTENEYFHRIEGYKNELNPETDIVYVAFSEDYLNLKQKEWKEDKEVATKGLILLLAFTIGFTLSFVYLALVVGRRSFQERELHLNFVDKLYIDINILLCIGLIGLWGAIMDSVNIQSMDVIVFPVTIPIAAIGFAFILSLVKHIKNRTFIKHSLIFTVIYLIYKFIKNVYDSGGTAVKTVLIVIGYPILVAATFFIFPITLGVAAWFAYKKVKTFNAIKEGVEQIKGGNLHHTIEVSEKGELGNLASNINSIADGLKKAVASELKSERLKTELITNVSHDIRTPLTSIITYVDLLKTEKDPSRVEEYIEVLDQKSKRLKVLTDDLFEAAKASSGNIPVSLEKINIVSLITQGFGEVNDKIEEMNLEFKLNHPVEKVYVTADGKLLWRSIENLLSNIFKYALKGSRVYIDIEDESDGIRLTFKNISAHELNISADELMERFKRGDEARTSQGSGLGLSIAKNLIEIQKGKFNIHVDGDLFKAMIYLPKHKSNNE